MRWGTQDRVKVRKLRQVKGPSWEVSRQPGPYPVAIGHFWKWEQAMAYALKLVGLA